MERYGRVYFQRSFAANPRGFVTILKLHGFRVWEGRGRLTGSDARLRKIDIGALPNARISSRNIIPEEFLSRFRVERC